MTSGEVIAGPIVIAAGQAGATEGKPHLKAVPKADSFQARAVRSADGVTIRYESFGEGEAVSRLAARQPGR